MVKWLCSVCNIYIYDEEKGDPETGIIPNTRLSELSDSWRCPVCGATIDKFIRVPEDDHKQKANVNIPGKNEDKKGILVGVDNPFTSSESKQEYGKPLGLPALARDFHILLISKPSCDTG
jgi:rubredoxin